MAARPASDLITSHLNLAYCATVPRMRFYRAMHCSAKRGIAIACRPLVRPSVCNVGGPGADRLEILKTNYTENYSPMRSLCLAQRPSIIPGEHKEI